MQEIQTSRNLDAWISKIKIKYLLPDYTGNVKIFEEMITQIKLVDPRVNLYNLRQKEQKCFGIVFFSGLNGTQ